MNVTVSEIGPCKKLVTIEVDQATVASTFASVEAEIQKHAHLQGFRKGKAPMAMVQKTYANDIKEEAKSKLVRDTVKSATKEQNIRVFSFLSVEEGEVDREKPMTITATVEIFPSFELPNYKGLPAKRMERVIGEEDVVSAIERLQARMANYNDVERAAAKGDIVVASYTGSIDGKPIAEIGADLAGLGTQKSFWIDTQEGAFIPGFADQLIGATAPSKRTVNVEFPAEYPSAAIAGKKAVYEVDIEKIKERVMPPMDDAFAKSWGAEDLNALKEGIRQDLQREWNDKQNSSVREQIVKALVDPITFDLPESGVEAETRRAIYDIVEENNRRGVSKDIIDNNKDEIAKSATGIARERMKANFILQRVAEKEAIRVDETELRNHLMNMANAMKMPMNKLVEKLNENNGINHIYNQLLMTKTIDFLQLHAKIEDAPVTKE